MTTLEWVGISCLGCIGLSLVIDIALVSFAYFVTRNEPLPINGIVWKFPLYVIFTAISWPLMAMQLAEITFDSNACGYGHIQKDVV